MKKAAIILISIIIVAILFSYSALFLINSDETIVKIDSDDDGVYDDEDDFPNDPAASIDTDKDGYPDEWNPGKNQDDNITNLTLDAFPDDPAASIDTDGDGYPDKWIDDKNQSYSTSIPPLEIDEFPNDPKAHKDTDEDGVADFYDVNDDVDLSIGIKILDFKVTSRVDILRWAQIYFDIIIDDKVTQRISNNEKPWWVLLNQKKTIDTTTFYYDIPDKTDKKTTKIEIIMYDYDFFIEDHIVDISDIANKNTLVLIFDNEANQIIFSGESEGSEGVLWYDISHSEKTIPDIDTYEKTYSWTFNNKNWKIYTEIPVKTYDNYLNANVNRMPQNDRFAPDKKMAAFVTTNEEVVQDIADELYTIAKENNYDQVTTANFILRFVQENIDYSLDNETENCEEYWRFPVETLVEQKGDCEDTSVLYAAFMDYLGYDVALLYYKWEENSERVGHLAVGIHLSGDHGEFVEDENGKKYYYCETTSEATIFKLGVIPDYPPQIKDGPAKIIPI